MRLHRTIYDWNWLSDVHWTIGRSDVWTAEKRKHLDHGIIFHNLVFNGIGQFFSEVLLRVLI